MGKRKKSRMATTSKMPAEKPPEASIMPVGKIEQAILLIRGEKVILDADLATLYGVGTKVLNQAVKRNINRFPEDFIFQLTWDEAKALRSQFVTSKGRGGRRYTPYAFTEHGAIMAATVLNSPRAVEVSVFVVRAFVRLRRMLAQHKELAGKLEELERKVGAHDRKIIALINAIRRLMAPPPEPPRKPIGFQSEVRR
jgi:hypothetical protein